jgi:hypothetical protein
MAATKPSRSARNASATVIASGHRDDAGEEGKRRRLPKRSACARDTAAARARRPRESRERTVGSSAPRADEEVDGDEEWRTKKEEWPRRRRRRSMESSAAAAAGPRREVAAAARAAGVRDASHRRIAARGEEEEAAAGLGFAAAW